MIRLYVSMDFIPSTPQIGSIISLSAEQSHYVRAVMRLSVGDELLIFNETIGEWVVKIQFLKKHTCDCLLSYLRIPAPGTTCDSQIHLFFSPLKHTSTHLVIEKGTELGVTHFHPVKTARSNTSYIRTEKLTKNAIEATEQSERLDCPVIEEMISLPEALEVWNNQYIIIAALERNDQIPCLLDRLTLNPPKKIGFFVGPEGGITAEEIKLFSRYHSLKTTHLGPRILRAETASIMLLSVYQALLQQHTKII